MEIRFNVMNIARVIVGCVFLAVLGSCSIVGLDLQEDYDYKASVLDPHINKTARQYLEERGKNPLIANDTIFKWMQLGLEYADIDLKEYEQSGRTFILLSTNAIRVRNATTGAITAGMWFDFPIMDKNPDGSQKFAADGVTPVTHPAKSWAEYSKTTVRNYFLYLIFQGHLGFENAKIDNTAFQTILPPGTVATKESRLGYVVTSKTPNFTPAGAKIITYDYVNGGSGFDPEGKINMKVVNSDYAPLQINDQTTVSTGGLIATNGTIHISSTTTFPWRY